MTWNDVGVALWPVLIVGLLWLGLCQFTKQDRRPHAGE
jgi:hypothetical protein